ncbi:MAG: hypothetical protein HY365_02250 [Candidatus Aenigmarchaeota archaeon]|nr:hypothetical protein [Candidatus Aenigmarchaeota archaeon]
MRQKHLFRFALKDIQDSKDTARVRGLSEELKRADETLSRHFQVHTIPIEYEEREKYHEYARDAMTQWKNAVYVKPPVNIFLSNYARIVPGIHKIFPHDSPELPREIRRAGYRGILLPGECMSEGGQFVMGDKFCLATDVYFNDKSAVKSLQRRAGKPVLPVYSFTSISHAHIDCDYAIVDDIRTLYTSLDMNAICAESELSDPLSLAIHAGEVNSRRTLGRIASEHGYDVRKYRMSEEPFPETSNGRYPNINGLNLLTGDGAIFTTNVHPGEKAYLQKRGIEVVVIPLGHTTPGAGLRCVYGEITIYNK